MRWSIPRGSAACSVAGPVHRPASWLPAWSCWRWDGTLSGPSNRPETGRGRARDVLFAVAYFVPTWSMRQMLREAANQGIRVRVIVPAKSDVEISRRAARHLYSTLLRRGWKIYEYEPQILHAKLYVTNASAYVGSSNLDTRSLYINHELMLRLSGAQVVRRAWGIGRTSLFPVAASRSGHLERIAWFFLSGPATPWPIGFLRGRIPIYPAGWCASRDRRLSSEP